MDLLGILRIKDSNGNWVSVPGLKGDTGEPFKILGIYATAAALEADVTDPEVGDVYLVGTTGAYDIYLYLADGWHNTGRYMPKGDQGDPAPAASITAAVETWLAANVDPETGYVLDRTLTQENAAAPADLVGDLKASIDEKIIPNANLLNTSKNTPNSYIKNTNGELTSYTGWQASDYIRIEPNTAYNFLVWNQSYWSATNNVYYAFYNLNKIFTHGSYTSATYGQIIESQADDVFVRVSAQNANMSTSTPIFGKATDISSLINDPDVTKYIPYGNTLVGDTTKQELDLEVERINAEFMDVAILLPSTVYIAVGRQITFYKPNFLRCKNPDDYVVYWSTNLTNTTFDENIRFKPATQGTFTATLFIMNRYNRKTITQKTIQIVVVPDTQRTGKTVLFIGDSLTASGFYPYEIQKHLSAEGVESIGTLSTTAYLDSDPTVATKVTVNHEGRGGWSAVDYTTRASKSNVANAFWNPTSNSFDFSYYMSQTGFSNPDIVFINLGTNGTGNPTAEIGAIKTIINSIKAYNSTIKIVVSAVACGNSTQNQYIDIYLTKLRELQLNEFDGVIENVYIAPIYLNINRRMDWKTETVAESERNPYEVTRQIDSVHPSKYGYYKFADVYWSVIQMILG